MFVITQFARSPRLEPRALGLSPETLHPPLLWRRLNEQPERVIAFLEQLALARLRISTGDEGFAKFNQLFRRIVTADFHDFRTCELIAPFIFDMPHMTFKPLPCDLMP